MTIETVSKWLGIFTATVGELVVLASLLLPMTGANAGETLIVMMTGIVVTAIGFTLGCVGRISARLEAAPAASARAAAAPVQAVGATLFAGPRIAPTVTDHAGLERTLAERPLADRLQHA